jgi:phospholipid N-methyltransferase
MHPQNSSDFFNEITLNTWKKYIVNSSISEINGELKEYIIKCYDEYISTTPFNEIDKKTYRAFLESKLPSTKLSFSTKTVDGKIRLKSCVNLLSYQNFFDNKQFNYTTFINYLVEHTFESLSHNSIIELQKSKLAKCFVELFTKYIEEL